MEELIGLGFAAGFFIISYFVGTNREKRHFENIIAREKTLVNLAAVTFKDYDERDVSRARLVTGNVVIAGDFFKDTVASLASFFGLRIGVAEGLLDRARREALLRMKESAPDADVIVNVRVESTKIGDRNNQQQKISGVEALAYGTAIYYKK